jgi:hypothetical protein
MPDARAFRSQTPERDRLGAIDLLFGRLIFHPFKNLDHARRVPVAERRAASASDSSTA